MQNDTLLSLIFTAHYNSLMNIHFIKGEFFAGTKLIPEVELKMEKFKDKIDEHHYLILYLKMAALLFGSKKYPECISYAMKIINSKGNVQEDLLFHTRILVLMAKFESGIDEDYDEFVKATQKFVQKMKYSDEIHQVIIEFFKNLDGLLPSEQQILFKNFENQLNTFSENDYYKRTLLYIDIHGWAKSKVKNVDVVEIIKGKVKKG